MSEYNAWTCARWVCSNHTLSSSWEFVKSLIGFQLFEDMPPLSIYIWDTWSCSGQKIEHNNYSHPLTTSTDGYAPSASSVNAARTGGLHHGRL